MAGVLLAAAAIAGLVLIDGSEEGGSEGSGPLSWVRDPRVTVPERLPGDRVLTGRLRNDSLRELRIPAEDVRLVGEDGESLEAVAGFVNYYIHTLFPPTRQPEELPDSELRRTGRLAVIEPGASVPITVSWHARDGGRAERLDYGAGSLTVK